jgi:hypothetical protein
MPTKRILLLANSSKGSMHCVAGRELIARGGKLHYGGWIRPINVKRKEGALDDSDCGFENGKQPKVLDVVDIEVTNNENYSAQPENWVIDSSKYWKRTAVDGRGFDLPIEKPANLWLDPVSNTDRVHPDNLPALKTNASLYLIKPENLRVFIGWKEWDGRWSQKRRATFTYNGARYDLGMTDPAIEKKYASPYPPQSVGMGEVGIESPKKCVICVSLPRPYERTGFHHKVVATIIEQ